MLRSPLLHFLLIGGLLFAAERHAQQSGWTGSGREVVRVSADDLRRLRQDWLRESGRPPTAAEMRAGVSREVDEAVMLHEARRLGLDREDAVVRERLLLNMRFAFPDSRAGTGELLRQARALHMEDSDVVVRRRLVQLMEQRMTRDVEVTDAALREYVDSHPGRYAAPRRYGFRQVFLSRDVAHRDAGAEAQALLARLRRDPGSADAANAGGAFLLGSRFPPSTTAEIARSFGPDFAAAVARLPAGTWSGPLASPYGLHLVCVDRVEAGGTTDFAAVRTQAAYAMRPELERRQLQAGLERLRRRYRIEIDDPGVAGEAGRS